VVGRISKRSRNLELIPSRRIMNRVSQLNPFQASGKTASLFGVVKRRTGAAANVDRVLGNSPAVLRGFLSLNQALSSGVLSAKLREQIALAVSEINVCAHCLSAHSLAGKRAGLSAAEISAARFGTGSGEKAEAVLDLVWAIVSEKGQIDNLDIQAARKAGFSDEEIVEVVANIALTLITNYVNHVARMVIDFPEVIPGVVSDDALLGALLSNSRPQTIHGYV